MRRLLILGVIAGAAGGLANAAFLAAVGERSIRAALAIEASRASHDSVVHHEMFTRPVQLVGGMLAALLFGACAGVIFAVVFAAVRHRSRAGDDFARALHLGAVTFITVVLVPQLKYPANPPAVGDPSTVNERTAAYLTLLGAAVTLAVGAWRGWHRLRERGVPDHIRIPAVGFGYCVAVAALYLAWPPTPDAVGVPATLIWHFRTASLAGMALLWAVLACTFGWLRGRSESAGTRREPAGTAA